MIEVKIKRNENEITIEMKGHSKFGKKGNDIVCAGISSVLQFIVIHLFNNLKTEGKFKLTSGEGHITVKRTEDSEKIVNSYEEFLKILNKSYPNTIKLES